MALKIIAEGIGNITLNDSDFKASGGEGDIYVKDKIAYKIYQDPNKMIPTKKIEELKQIASPNVLAPKGVIYDKNNSPIGYWMDFVSNSNPLCKLFTKSFKNRNNLSQDDILFIIKEMQTIVEKIHSNPGYLVVDMNELNVLIDNKFKTPFFIDVDSYETKNYKCTAIMDSIRDRLAKGNKWTQLSDWYSFAILAFQMLIGLHPYKGGHPKYSNGDFATRMQDGVSVFDKDATMPAVAYPLTVLPPALFDWFKSLFHDNKRLPPPDWKNVNGIFIPDYIQKFVQKVVNTLFETELKFKFNQQINHVFGFMGINYFVAKDGVYKMNVKMPLDTKNSSKTLFCESGGGEPIVALLFTDEVKFYSGVKLIGTVKSEDMMYRNGCIYTINAGMLIENSFTSMGDKTIHLTRSAGMVLENATQIYDGVVFQNLLGKMHITLPYENGKILIKAVPELNGVRIISATSKSNVCVVVGEIKGKYNRYYLTLNDKYDAISVRIEKDVSCLSTNLAVLPSGVAVLALDTEIELFKGANGKIIPNTPADTDNTLYVMNGSLYYIDGDSLYTLKTK